MTGEVEVSERRRWWLLAALVLLVAGIAAAAALNLSDRYYRFGWIPTWALPACWTAALIALGFDAASRPAPRRMWIRATLVSILASLTLLFWGIAMVVAMLFDDNKVVAVEMSPDGRFEAAMESVGGIDPSCRVMLRERGWILSRQTLVSQPFAGPCPAHVSFGVGDTISIVVADGQEPQTTTFDADRMRVTRVLPTSVHHR
ncbi:Uncharacterised protein [Nocardia otitidiscaviarum]|uniref:Uncharacterized protein n=1 Tax=Nocardia otitidiscaviarum TaxID=1823 RepID=A0A378Y7F9_9NOCA|nr:hypothetical protein [Nocardia otitidiscaviarum]SUA73145.1 Uncharacterised protein [Nocardia otitidiscaviarum]